MGVFEIRDAFYLKDQPFKILSGAIHYFRIDPADWYHSLYNLKGFGVLTRLRPMSLGMRMNPAKGSLTLVSIGSRAFHSNSPVPRTLHDCKAVALYLCRVGIWWIASLALRRRPANPLIRPSLYRSGGSLL